MEGSQKTNGKKKGQKRGIDQIAKKSAKKSKLVVEDIKEEKSILKVDDASFEEIYEKEEHQLEEKQENVVQMEEREVKETNFLERDLPPRIPQSMNEKEGKKRLYVILDGANLETVKTKRDFELFNCDDHVHLLKKKERDANDARPDITHQCLLALLDSPLNKAGLLQIYIRTSKGVLIEVNPHIRIPRTFKRFSGLMVQLLHKMSIRSTNSTERLLRVVKNPVTQYFPTNCKKIGMEADAKKLVDIEDYVKVNFGEEPAVFVIGAFAHGSISCDYLDETVCISQYSLSAAVTCSKVCVAFERLWGVL